MNGPWLEEDDNLLRARVVELGQGEPK
jgi:hypothetical protein